MGPRAVALERRLERPMLAAAALVLPALILEHTENGTYRSIAAALDWAIWIAFTAELVAMLVVVRIEEAAAGSAGRDLLSRLDAIAVRTRELGDEVEALRAAVADGRSGRG